jgi:hypothetical protein
MNWLFWKTKDGFDVWLILPITNFLDKSCQSLNIVHRYYTLSGPKSWQIHKCKQNLRSAQNADSRKSGTATECPFDAKHRFQKFCNVHRIPVCPITPIPENLERLQIISVWPETSILEYLKRLQNFRLTHKTNSRKSGTTTESPFDP